MLFSSMLFLWVFLPIVFVGNFILYKLGRNTVVNMFLLFASLLFYAWGEPAYIFLMVISITINWLFGMLVDKFNNGRKGLLVLVIILNLSLLGFFKYAGMIILTFNKLLGTSLQIPNIALPIGISFFTFQALSYVIDVYRGNCKVQHNYLKLALYVSFFPQLIAGPIVKYKDIAEQIDNRSISVEQTAEGIRRFIYGLGKKVLISNTLALSVDQIYAIEISHISSALAWIASLLYTLQIYYDFSGYSDMAIGLGKMFGFEFKENFNYPYISLSVREFWRRWHISLSTWFREYVYIPLGGSRTGNINTYRNLIIVFFLTGLWHGASYSFVFWGLFHGLFIIMERLALGKILEKNKIIAWLYTFMVVNIGWVFFRIDHIKNAFSYIKRMILPWRYSYNKYSVWEYLDMRVLFILICSIIGMGIFQQFFSHHTIASKWKHSITEIIWIMLILFISIMQLASSTYNPFIYFRF